MYSRNILGALTLIVLLAVSAGAQTDVPDEGLVVEASFCTAIEDRMPVGESDTFAPDVDTVFMWCRVTGCPDTTAIKLVWTHEGTERATVELPVKSPAWRTWSSKIILPEWTGAWEVKVFDVDGNVLKAAAFTIAAQAAEPVGTE